ncbi:MAG TPA: response regulator [Dehalococcoidia bacterium]|nr:response regulator [Dehalococcoidia bacterium]
MVSADTPLVQAARLRSLVWRSGAPRRAHADDRDIAISAGHVLVIDDDPDMRRLLRFALNDFGFQVTTAENGAEALAQLEEGAHPHAIVLDLEMPRMDGRAFYAELRRRGIDTPVLVLSAYGAERAARELKLRFALAKPFDLEELVQTLRNMIGGSG